MRTSTYKIRGVKIYEVTVLIEASSPDDARQQFEQGFGHEVARDLTPPQAASIEVVEVET